MKNNTGYKKTAFDKFMLVFVIAAVVFAIGFYIYQIKYNNGSYHFTLATTVFEEKDTEQIQLYKEKVKRYIVKIQDGDLDFAGILVKCTAEQYSKLVPGEDYYFKVEDKEFLENGKTYGGILKEIYKEDPMKR